MTKVKLQFGRLYSACDFALRLKHIHLAGFKSFVDPVSIPAPTNLTGIVGPNGCGKSNVIDAVRWVLGESKARELRGETLQDVIFNGSAQRKPAARAVVELLFDNSDGRAPGQWASYAEISVKRVLTRHGDSSYFLNNVHVRRRDVTDLILGTGLGGDAYAIIEQGTISRLIEARPEDLRGHLEEAAGVSKYRERRRETEHRLRDTRENLDRVEDIRGELQRQIERLTVQAEVARRYFDLQAERQWREAQLALVRRRDAQAVQARVLNDQLRVRVEMDACGTTIRQAERQAEEERQRQHENLNQLNQTQAAYYAAGAEVTRLEQMMAHLREQRHRLEMDLQRVDERQRALLAETASADHARTDTALALNAAEAKIKRLEAAWVSQKSALPEVESAMLGTRAAHTISQGQLASLQQDAALARNQREQSMRSLQQLEQRMDRLTQELGQLAQADPLVIERMETEHANAEAALIQADSHLLAGRNRIETAEQAWRTAHATATETQRALHHCEAQYAALTRLQQQNEHSETQTAVWLARHKLTDCKRLWQIIEVNPHWETAVEAVLGPRLEALAEILNADWLMDLPGTKSPVTGLPLSRLDFPLGGTTTAPVDRNLLPTDLAPLAEQVRCQSPVLRSFLDTVLAGVGCVEDLPTALARHAELPWATTLVTPEGHCVSAHSVTLNALDPARQGILRRTRELAELNAEKCRLQVANEASQRLLKEAETERNTARASLDAMQQSQRVAQTQAHQSQIRLLHAREAAQRRAARQAQIEHDQAEIAVQQTDETTRRTDSETRLAHNRTAIQALESQLQSQRQDLQRVDAQLSALRTAEREAQQALQSEQMVLHTMTLRLERYAAETERQTGEALQLESHATRVRNELATLVEGPLMASLQTALDERHRAEATLVVAREALEGSQQALRGHEQARVQAEQALDPLRARLQALELKHQEARIKEAQFAEQLAQHLPSLSGPWAGFDEAAVAATLVAEDKEARLSSEMIRLHHEIEVLGAVNMVALAELEAASERLGYLNAQVADLEAAVATLEGAIARIDAESRANLQSVYDRVSLEFKTFFQELFGGGEAQLVLTGEDILEAGLSIVAQPPGKKNSSIHLLSGGEKALTALSLVFALFRLNPAPFCLLDEVDAPLDDSNTERYCRLVQKMSAETQFLFITHNRLTMEMARHLVGVTMPEPGVSRPVVVDVEGALQLTDNATPTPLSTQLSMT